MDRPRLIEPDRIAAAQRRQPAAAGVDLDIEAEALQRRPVARLEDAARPRHGRLELREEGAPGLGEAVAPEHPHSLDGGVAKARGIFQQAADRGLYGRIRQRGVEAHELQPVALGARDEAQRFAQLRAGHERLDGRIVVQDREKQLAEEALGRDGGDGRRDLLEIGGKRQRPRRIGQEDPQLRAASHRLEGAPEAGGQKLPGAGPPGRMAARAGCGQGPQREERLEAGAGGDGPGRV